MSAVYNKRWNQLTAYSSCNEMTAVVVENQSSIKPKHCYQFGKHTAVKTGFRIHRMLKTEIWKIKAVQS